MTASEAAGYWDILEHRGRDNKPQFRSLKKVGSSPREQASPLFEHPEVISE